MHHFIHQLCRCAGPALALLEATGALAAAPGIELRAYPAGAILTGDVRFTAPDRVEWGLSAGYDFARRGDAGRHDDERGGGPGIGLYARRYGQSHSWFWGGRAELFQLDIDWRDDGSARGSSDITVLQPTAQLGYRFAQLPDIDLSVSAHLGAEINLATRGEKVGEGAIGLIGLHLGF